MGSGTGWVLMAADLQSQVPMESSTRFGCVVGCHGLSLAGRASHQRSLGEAKTAKTVLAHLDCVPGALVRDRESFWTLLRRGCTQDFRALQPWVCTGRPRARGPDAI